MVLGYEKVMCKICNHEHLVEVIQLERVVQFHKQEVIYNDIHMKCLNATENNEYYTPELKERNLLTIIDQFRLNNNLLKSDDIFKIRQKYNLSSQELSILLGFNTNEVYLYETNTVQSHEKNELLLKANNNPNFLYHRLKRTSTMLISSDRQTEIEIILLNYISKQKDFFDD